MPSEHAAEASRRRGTRFVYVQSWAKKRKRFVAWCRTGKGITGAQKKAFPTRRAAHAWIDLWEARQ